MQCTFNGLLHDILSTKKTPVLSFWGFQLEKFGNSSQIYLFSGGFGVDLSGFTCSLLHGLGLLLLYFCPRLKNGHQWRLLEPTVSTVTLLPLFTGAHSHIPRCTYGNCIAVM